MMPNVRDHRPVLKTLTPKTKTENRDQETGLKTRNWKQKTVNKKPRRTVIPPAPARMICRAGVRNIVKAGRSTSASCHPEGAHEYFSP